MQVTLIGSGNVGTVLGRMFMDKGHHIRQVYSRQARHAEALAAELKAEPVTDITAIDLGADLYILCVTDDITPAIAASLSLGDKLLVHTAGSVGKEVLAGASTRYGVVWPMKMIRTTMRELGTASVIIDGNTQATIAEIREIAALLSDTVFVAGDTDRLKMHMISSVAANFTNHLYHLAADYCEREGIDFRIFHSIIAETARAIQSAHPADVQAGPAFRGDRKTLARHEALLQNDPALLSIYQVLTRSLLRKHGHTD